MLTDQQLSTLAAHIRANSDSEVQAALAAGNVGTLADIYNRDSAFIVWRTEIPVAEYRAAIVWAECDSLQIGKARIWEWLTANMTVPINAANPSVRQGLADCWAANSSTRPALLAISKRAANLVESLFSTGTGTDVSPGTLVYEGQVGYPDVAKALNEF